MIYLFLFSYIYVKAILFELLLVKKTDLFLYLIIILILCFSYQNGADWRYYQDFYENIAPNLTYTNFFNDDTYFERGYALLNFIFYNFLNYEIFMGLVSGICAYVIIKNLISHSHNSYIAISLYLSAFFLTALLEPTIRQVIAMTIIIHGLKYIEKNKFVSFLLIIIFAAQFHQSAYIFIILYFVNKINLNFTKTIILFVFMTVFISNIEIILFYMSDFLPILKKYLVYFQSERIMNYERSFIVSIYFVVQSIIYLIIIFYAYDKYEYKKLYVKNLAIISVILQYLSDIFPILVRINSYLSFFLFVALSYIGYLSFTMKNKHIIPSQGLRIFLISFLIITNVLVWKISLNSSDLNTYKFFQYKNYFIEMLKGDLHENGYEKINNFNDNAPVDMNEIDHIVK
ncbi:MAG: hypothetical protein COA92_02575 [Sulfurovum sp.]|nr:MAG: hypothetical protein COA92_02575 [Sulfurovum sp.]